jgi:hypothetical protein
MIPINYLAIIAAAVVSMVVGFLWYGPLFGKKWSEAAGFTPERMAEAKQKDMSSSYALMFVGALIMNYVLAHMLIFASSYTATTGAAAGLMAGFWSWLGFIAPVSMGSVLWDGKPWTYWFITAGYYLAVLLINGVILALWV